MKRAVIVVMSAIMMFLISCSNMTEQTTTKTELSDMGQSEIIRTEKSLNTLLEAIRSGGGAESVTLVGKLDLGTNRKWDPSKLIVGKASVIFAHQLDKGKYNGQTVLVKADIWHSDKLAKLDSQVPCHTIVNVQHVEIMEQP